MGVAAERLELKKESASRELRKWNIMCSWKESDDMEYLGSMRDRGEVLRMSVWTRYMKDGALTACSSVARFTRFTRGLLQSRNLGRADLNRVFEIVKGFRAVLLGMLVFIQAGLPQAHLS